MSTAIIWSPIKGTYLEKGPSSMDSVAKALNNAFGNAHTDIKKQGITLNGNSIPILLGMKYAGMTEVQNLINAINDHGEILVKAEV